MTYLPTPLPVGSKPSGTYQNLNVNATQSNTQYGSDHVAFDAGANNGQHTKITFPTGIADPTPTGSQQIIYPQGSGSTLGINVISALGTFGLTNIQTTMVGSAPYQLNRMVTPWGLILYYGIVTRNATPTFTITYTDSSEVTQYVNLIAIGTGTTSAHPTNAGTASCSFNLGTIVSGTLNFAILIITKVP